MKIYVVACLHGEELFGLKIIAQLQALGAARVFTHIAHPEAIAKHTRYLDNDLNRSFGAQAKPSRETTIAQRLLADIAAARPDIVLDLHTSHGEVGKVAIVATSSPKLTSLAHRLGVQQVVVMPPNISKDSLIGQLPTKAMSLEFGTGLRSDKLARQLAESIAELQIPRNLQPTALPVYKVSRLIKNHEARGETLHNYVFNKTLNGYPFLVGKNTYQTFRGFLAHKHQ